MVGRWHLILFRSGDEHARVRAVDILVVTHDSFERHDPGKWHPERPARLAAAVRGVYAAGLPVEQLPAPEVDRALLERFHDASYVGAIEQFCAAGGGALDPDTHVVPASWEAAIRAAGAGPAAVDRIRDATSMTAFLAVRPPGHHALHARAMGFCLFNNIGVTARYLLEAGQRVAILDWDVHHGNGTEDSFAAEPDVLYVSLHQHPFYPGTGWLSSLGSGTSAGTTVNVPLPAGTGGDVYREAIGRIVVPIIRHFAPDWVLVSAGYDAHWADPLAEIRLLESDYAYMASAVHSVSRPVVYFLEGGYDLDAIRGSVAATLRAAAGQTVADEESRPPSHEGAWRALDEAHATAQRFWDL